MNLLFVPNGKLMVLGVPVFTHIRVGCSREGFITVKILNIGTCMSEQTV